MGCPVFESEGEMSKRKWAWIMFLICWWMYPIAWVILKVCDFCIDSVDIIERKFNGRH